jgi:DNA-binding IclR family transcriptional regulator
MVWCVMASGQPATAASAPKYRVELIDKVFALLGSFAPDRPELTLREIVETTGQSHSSAYRILVNLTRHGVLERDDDTHRYRIGPRLHELGSLAYGDLRRVVAPALGLLRDQFGYTANLSVRAGEEVILVEVLSSPRPFSLTSSVGAREPLAATASGKCLLAFAPPAERAALLKRVDLCAWTPTSITSPDAVAAELERVRARVWAIDEGEYVSHGRCVAVPLFDRLGAVCAAISLSGPDDMLAPGRLDAVAARLLDVGAAVSRELGCVAGYPPLERARQAAGDSA